MKNTPNQAGDMVGIQLGHVIMFINCKMPNCKSLPFFNFLIFEKGRLLYIH